MSKSILVIDTPENCEECPFARHRIDCIPEDFCTLDKCKRDIINPNIKPDWCSLKEMPQKYETVSMSFERGYNACVEDILKEFEE